MEFAEELARFRARVGARRIPALIIPGSGQATTAALLVGALQPERVAFLLTPDSAAMPADVARLLDCPQDAGWQVWAEDHTDPLQIYRSLREIIAAWVDLPRSQVAVDLTGGTKPMSVGLAKAAYVLEIETLYIESDFAVQGGRRLLLPGTQRLVPPPDPYVVFGDLEAAEATRLFAAHDYAGAARLFAALARRLDAAATGQAPLKSLAASHLARATLAAAYNAWDSFDLDEAQRRLREHLALARPTGSIGATLDAQVRNLARLATVAGHAAGRGQAARDTLADPEAVLVLLGSLLANALRREAQGRFDTAALLQYRCLELCSQHRLARWGILTEQPTFDTALQARPDLDRAYRAVEERVGFQPRGMPRPNRNGKTSPIALFGGYMLLAALDDPLVEGFPIEQIRERAVARNRSILAHGYKLISEAEYRRFAEIVDTVLERLLALVGQDRATWLAEHRFLALPETN
jgi:CRISPR-associated protein (TIGR02710 family)